MPSARARIHLKYAEPSTATIHSLGSDGERFFARTADRQSPRSTDGSPTSARSSSFHAPAGLRKFITKTESALSSSQKEAHATKSAKSQRESPAHMPPFKPTAHANRRVALTDPLPARRPGLGPLESKVLELLWGHDGAATVRDVHAALPELAYTTLMTTLDRLYRKGVLTRRRRGRAFSYEARCSRIAMLGELVSGHVADLLAASGASSAILSSLVHAVGRRDAVLLDELDALVQAERERLKSEDK